VCGDLVSIREVESADAPALFELLSDPVVAAHLSTPPPSVRAFAGFVSWAQQQRTRGEGLCFGIVPHGLQAAVGIIQIRALEPTFFTAEWGFAIGAAFWGTGAFLEAAHLAATFAFDTLNVHRLEARAVTENRRGNGVLAKLGAHPEGALASGLRRDSRRDDQFLWSLMHADLQQRSLVNGLFSAVDATREIRAAIGSIRSTLMTNRRTRLLEPPPLYPFFLT
jgi:ribosomal-protein-alanine N-acetyltransferase